MQKHHSKTTLSSLFTNSQDLAVIGILQDAIVWDRVSSNMLDIVNAFSPKEFKHDFETSDQHHGYVNAFHIMGIYDKDALCEQLASLFYNFREDTSSAKDLAEVIYLSWLVCIKNYCAALNTVA
jgi:hypothetical protein